MCTGAILHKRDQPYHEFTYSVSMLLVDASSDYESRWLSKNRRWKPLRLGSTEWWGGDDNLLVCLNKHLENQGYELCDQVFMLAQPRTFGSYFNPVCFYFCLKEGAVICILTEINNTPWDEKFSYILDARNQHNDLQFNFSKEFHVSPFLPMDLEYLWRFNVNPNSINIGMEVLKDDHVVLRTVMHLQTTELCDLALGKVALRFPFQNISTLLRIYWQAFRLYLKRAKFYEHPGS